MERRLSHALHKTRLFGAAAGPDTAEDDEAWAGKLVGASGYSRCGRTDRGVSALGQVERECERLRGRGDEKDVRRLGKMGGSFAA